MKYLLDGMRRSPMFPVHVREIHATIEEVNDAIAANQWVPGEPHVYEINREIALKIVADTVEE